MIWPATYEVLRLPDGEMMPESTGATCHFLYGLVRLLKPARIVEVGTHRGVALAWMVRAAVENRNGARVIGYEIEERLRAEAAKQLELCAAGEAWEVRGDFFAEPEPVGADFVFLDLDPKSDYERAFKWLKIPPGGTLVADDMLKGPYTADAQRLSFRLMEMPWQWSQMTLDGERGLLLARRLA